MSSDTLPTGTSFDPETGKSFIYMPKMKYAIGEKIIFAHNASFQAKISIKMPNGLFSNNQLMIGTITGALFNPDGGMQWKYYVKHPQAQSDQIVAEKDVYAIETDTEEELPKKKVKKDLE